MLEVVRIRDYTLIEALDIELCPGLNALTGETGAGKSIVVGALGLALGARASGDTVRAGAEKASIEAIFRLKRSAPRLEAILEDMDVPRDEDMLILSRTITSDGRSRAQVNGKMVTITSLAAIGDELVDLHGQHEHQSLLRAECQLALLDGFAGTESEVKKMARLMTHLNQLHRTIETLESDDRDRTRQLELLRHEVKEIDAAALMPDEEKELRERLHLITNAETIHTLARQSYGALYESEEGAAIDRVDAALRDLEALEGIDAAFTELRCSVGEARALIEGVAEGLRAFTTRMEFDPNELDELNERLALIGDLKRKYGDDIPAILAYRDKAAADIEDYDNRDARLEEMKAEYARIRAEADETAAGLSKNRRRAARDMDAQALRLLHLLDMPQARFETQIDPMPLAATGADRVAFMLSANAGENLKPLRQVASGGEISRIMLALKAVFAEQDAVPTLVFDEIDAGIGGATARRVGDTLAVLAKTHQVVCITHLPQIAAAATAHYVVAKEEAAHRTSTRVYTLADKKRQEEIARLLDGSISDVSLKHARALLAEFEPKPSSKKKDKEI